MAERNSGKSSKDEHRKRRSKNIATTAAASEIGNGSPSSDSKSRSGSPSNEETSTSKGLLSSLNFRNRKSNNSSDAGEKKEEKKKADKLFFLKKMRKRKVERIPVFEVSGERERVLLGQILITENDTTDSMKLRVAESYGINYNFIMYRWNSKAIKALPDKPKKASAFFGGPSDKLIVTNVELEAAVLPSLFAVGPREVELMRVSIFVDVCVPGDAPDAADLLNRKRVLHEMLSDDTDSPSRPRRALNNETVQNDKKSNDNNKNDNNNSDDDDDDDDEETESDVGSVSSPQSSENSEKVRKTDNDDNDDEDDDSNATTSSYEEDPVDANATHASSSSSDDDDLPATSLLRISQQRKADGKTSRKPSRRVSRRRRVNSSSPAKQKSKSSDAKTNTAAPATTNTTTTTTTTTAATTENKNGSLLRIDVSFQGRTYSTTALPKAAWRSDHNLGFIAPDCEDDVLFALVSISADGTSTVLASASVSAMALSTEEPVRAIGLKPAPIDIDSKDNEISKKWQIPNKPAVLLIRVHAAPVVLQAPDGGDVPLEQRGTLSTGTDAGGAIVGDIDAPTLQSSLDMHAPSDPNLILQNKSLRVIPDRVFSFARLQVLSLQSNAIVTVPSRIGSLRQLRVLRLWANQLSSLPDELALLPSLETLDIGKNQFTKLPRVIFKLTSLRDLQVHWNLFTSLPAGLSHLTRLRTFNASINRLTSINSKLSSLTCLERLELSHNNLTSLPSFVPHLVSLEVLLLSGNCMQSLDSSVTRLRSLCQLDVGGNKLAFLPAALQRLSNLRILTLRNNELRTLPRHMTRLGALKELTISDNRLTDVGGLCSLTALERLFAWKNRLRSLPPEISNLTRLVSLDAADNRLTSLPSTFGLLTSLRMCQLSRNELKQLPREIGQLTLLADLAVFGNKLEKLPSSIGKLTSLQAMRVQNNHLKELPSSLTALTRLSMLDLGNNRLSAAPAWLGSLTCVQTLSLFGNRITSSAPLPSSLGQLKHLTALYLSYANLLHHWPSNVAERLAPSLQTLHLDGNAIFRLPQPLSSLVNLIELNVGSNQLQELPSWLTSLRRLIRLHAPANKLQSLPSELYRCTTLQELNVSHNSISSLSADIGLLRSLVDLDVSNNMLKSLPSELKSLGNLQFVKLTANRCGRPKNWPRRYGAQAGTSTVSSSPRRVDSGQGVWLETAFHTTKHERRVGFVDDQAAHGEGLDDESALGWAEMLGRRPTQEDAVVVLPPGHFRTGTNESFYGVFDGHGGHRAAQFCAERMPHVFATLLTVASEAAANGRVSPLSFSSSGEFEPPEDMTGHGRRRRAPRNRSGQRSTTHSEDTDSASTKSPRDGVRTSSGTPLEQLKQREGRASLASSAFTVLTTATTTKDVDSTTGSTTSSATPSPRPHATCNNDDASGGGAGDDDDGLRCTSPPLPSNVVPVRGCPNAHITAPRSWLTGRLSLSQHAAMAASSSPESQRTAGLHTSSGGLPAVSTNVALLASGSPKDAPAAALGAPAIRAVSSNSVQRSRRRSSVLPGLSAVDYGDVFVTAFQRANSDLDARGIADGCAAVCAYVVGQLCVLAHAGDSRAVLYNQDGSIRAATDDHKPQDKREIARIRAANGFVTENGRVCGTLGLARAIGDGPFQPIVSCVPDITLAPLNGAPCCLVMACDGVWDVMTNEEAWLLVAEEPSPVRAALALRDYAHCLGSSDNISTVVVHLNGYSRVAARPLAQRVDTKSDKKHRSNNDDEAETDADVRAFVKTKGKKHHRKKNDDGGDSKHSKKHRERRNST